MNTRTFEKRTNSKARQTGVVLVISMIILIVMTLIGLTAVRMSVMEEKMAGNIRDHNLAFQSAEAALRDANTWLQTDISQPPSASEAANSNVYTSEAINDLGYFGDRDFPWDNNSIRYGSLSGTANEIGTCSPSTSPPSGSDLSDLHALPCYVIEEYDFVPDDLNPDTSAKGIGKFYYRVTAIGYGGSSKAQSVLQATFSKRFHY